MNLGSFDKASLDFLRPILPFPTWQKLAVLGGGFVLIVALYVTLQWMPLHDDIVNKEKQVSFLETKHRQLTARAKNLEAKKIEYKELERSLKVALKMLPKKSQIPDLLEEMSQIGKESGLKFIKFKPRAEVARENLYAEVPVDLNVTATYRDLLIFLKKIGEMPRIVNVKDLILKRGGGNMLTISGLAMTYRFIEKPPAKGTGQ